MKDRWRQLDQLYRTALERDPAARAAFLDAACRRDDTLRRDVEMLLANEPALDDPTATVLTSGARLGPYRLEAVVGAGGMGEVFRAHDTRLGRTGPLVTGRQH